MKTSARELLHIPNAAGQPIEDATGDSQLEQLKLQMEKLRLQ